MRIEEPEAEGARPYPRDEGGEDRRLEHMVAAAEVADEPGTMASRLPAFLLLLESGLTPPRRRAVAASQSEETA
jgi:hypothetical protein